MLSSAWNWAVIIPIVILEAWAASVMASRKGRSGGWGTLTLFFQPALLLLWVLSSKKGAEQASLRKCPVCEKAISSEATACPHCGQPQTTDRQSRRRGYFVEAAGLTALLTSIALLVVLAVRNGGTGLPTCDSQTAENDVERIMADAPLFKLTGARIINLTGASTLSTTQNETKCHAVAILNDTTKHQISYRYYVNSDNTFIEAKMDDIP